jgi:hypothetical protein
MTYDVVDRGVEHIGKVVLALTGRTRSELVDDHPLDKVVEFHGDPTFLRDRIETMEYGTKQPPRFRESG